MCKKDRLLNHVKEIVDTLYELAIEGYKGPLSSLNDTMLMKASSEMIKRGVISKTRSGDGFVYRWIAESAPTDAFYKSITEKLRSRQREIDERRSSCDEAIPIVVTNNSIKQATSQELWDELKLRGYAIEDGQLVAVRKVYLR